MASHFDPARTRASFDTFLLRRELTESSEKYSVLGRAAIMRLGNVVKAWLVGLNREMEPALRQCNEWLAHSIDNNEDLGDIHIPASRSGAFALSNWMLHAQNDEAFHLKSLDEFEIYFNSGGRREVSPDRFNTLTQRFEPVVAMGLPIAKEEILGGYLGDYLAACIQADQCERGAKLYERVAGSVDINSDRLRKIEDFGYWLCLQRLRGYGPPSAAHVPVGERVLGLHMEASWLSQGQATRAATWLKILYWHSDILRDPLAVVLKAYDLMPGVQKRLSSR